MKDGVRMAVADLPGVDNVYILKQALSKYANKEITRKEFIAIHYEWIYDNVLDQFDKKPLPIQNASLHLLEEEVKGMSDRTKNNPSSEERELMDKWLEFSNKVNAVVLENETNLRWLKAMDKYFRSTGQSKKAEDVRQLVLNHAGEVDWK